VMRQPDVNTDGAVNTGVVVVTVRTINIGSQSAGRRIGDRVLETAGVAPGTKLIRLW